MTATLTAPVGTANTTEANDSLDRFYRLSVHQYEEMTRLGILTENDKVELLEGLIVAKMTKHSPHVVSTLVAFARISSILPKGWYATKEDPIIVGQSEPEPDVAVVRGVVQDYLKRKPTDEVALVVEVADSSLQFDRTVKKLIYASGNLPIYWLVNINDRCVEVYENPTGPCDTPDYRKKTIVGENETLPLILDGQEIGRIAVSELLP